MSCKRPSSKGNYTLCGSSRAWHRSTSSRHSLRSIGRRGGGGERAFGTSYAAVHPFLRGGLSVYVELFCFCTSSPSTVSYHQHHHHHDIAFLPCHHCISLFRWWCWRYLFFLQLCIFVLLKARKVDLSSDLKGPRRLRSRDSDKPDEVSQVKSDNRGCSSKVRVGTSDTFVSVLGRCPM